MVEVPSLLVSIFSLLVNNAEAFVIAPPWADDNANPCSEVSIDMFFRCFNSYRFFLLSSNKMSSNISWEL